MSTDRVKYVSVSSKEAQMLAMKMSSLAAEGYTCIEVFHSEAFGDFYAFMKLKEEAGITFRGVEECINVGLTSDGQAVKEKLAEGYVIIANYAKQLTLVKRRPSEKIPISPNMR